MKFTLLALAGLAAAGPVADMQEREEHGRGHKVEVTRFATPGCPESSKFKGTDDVKDGECENYSGSEPGFLSFKAKITENKKHRLGKHDECRLYAFEKKGCKGKSVA